MVYVKLWNGHKPGQLPDDCGEDGPIFGPYDNVQVTYGGHVKMWSESSCDDLTISANGWIEYDGVLYGDFSITSSNSEKPSYNGPAYLSDRLYTRFNGIHCPVCGSNQVEGSETDINAGGATQECSCPVCESTWVDAYNLIGYCNLNAALPPDTLVRITASYDWSDGSIGERRWITRSEWATEEKVLEYLATFTNVPLTLKNWVADPL